MIGLRWFRTLWMPHGDATLLDEADIHARARTLPAGPDALDLWLRLAAMGNPEAPERLRGYALSDARDLREPARAALAELGLSHDAPMP